LKGRRVRRLSLVFLVVAALFAALALPAAAYPPGARTDFPTEVTDSGATLNGIAYPSDGQGTVTYHFEYGPTKAYGQVTPEGQAPASAPPTQPAVSARVVLPGGSTFHFRIVATNGAGEKGVGEDIEWATPGPPPAEPGATRHSETVPPGGSLSVGTDPTKENPVVVTVTSESGGKLTVDEFANPDRPGVDPDAEVNPEDDSPKDKHWFGSAFRIYPAPVARDPEGDPDAAAGTVTTVVFRIDGDTLKIDPTAFKRMLSGREFPRTEKACGEAGTRRVLAGGDIQLTFKDVCTGNTFHFYNPGWGVRGGEYFGSFGGDLKRAVEAGNISFGLYCILECERTVIGTIAKKSARKLGLKSAVLGRVHTDPGEEYDGQFPLSAKVRKAFKRITRKGGQITISFQAKAVGPGGQVFKKSNSARFKAESESDSF
jgi:hypothetical protein